ncbi:DUF3772 domain-containing protein [Brevirhabdus pacifica]|uniref:DUF3772 domain-containing protein n=1 Tax=Brevirhabdus pacifica TaxID=1267768 RepID=UPI00117EB4C2|nr:DUF3772 domain-containing protein [Brevirhabdus pacifica]
MILLVLALLSSGAAMAQQSGSTAGQPQSEAPVAAPVEGAPADGAAADAAAADGAIVDTPVPGTAVPGLLPVLEPSPSQAADTPDYARWEATATRAEEAIQAGRASTVALEELRAQIADWRAQFQSAQDANAARIRTLRQQIDVLGPEPKEGETEAPEIARRRAELNSQLSTAQAPGIRAEEAYRQADGIIREIDRLVRERQADALLELGSSPLNPRHWGPALEAITQSVMTIQSEVASAWGRPAQQREANDNLPRILIFFAIGALLILRSRRWVETLITRLQARPRLGTSVAIFALSLGQVGLPILGIYLLTRIVYALGIVGLRGDAVLSVLPIAALAILGATWIGRMTLSSDLSSRLVDLTPERAWQGRWSATLLGWTYAVWIVLATLAASENYSEPTRAVLNFGVLVVGGLLLFRLGQILANRTRPEPAEEEPSYRDRLLTLLGRGVIAISILAPLLAAVGFGMFSAALLFPTILTLGLLALMGLLQKLVVDIYAVLVRGEDRARDALIPVLIGFALSLAALPVAALIWGARVSDLTELWARFSEGFQIGETRISPTDFVTFVVVFVLGYLATRLVQGTIRNSVLPKTKIDVGGRNAIVAGLGYVGIFLAAVVAITMAGIDLSSLAIVAGALSVGIGFGLQNIVSNFVSGIILLIERPVSEGDWIEVGGTMGYVRAISVRSTRIETFDRTDVIVPNADLISGTVTNYTLGNLIGRVIVPVGVAYGTDTRKVEKVLQEIVQAHPMVLANPRPGVLFQGFGADSMDFEIRAILRDVNFLLPTKSELNHAIAKRFAEEGIEIPFAQRDVWLRNPEVLQPGGGGAPAGAPPAEEEQASKPEEGTARPEGEMSSDVADEIARPSALTAAPDTPDPAGEKSQ